MQSACHAVERAAQALHVPLEDAFLQQANSLLITKLRAACQLRLRLVRPLPLPFAARHLPGFLTLVTCSDLTYTIAKSICCANTRTLVHVLLSWHARISSFGVVGDSSSLRYAVPHGTWRH